MRATIDGAGRIVVPKVLREQLGFTPGSELDLVAVDGRLQVEVPPRTRIEYGPHGPEFAADGAATMSVAQVRELTERGRR